VEYDASKSKAVERIAGNRTKAQLVVKYRGGTVIYLYSNVPDELFVQLESGAKSIGDTMLRVKQVTSCRKVQEFTRNTVRHKAVQPAKKQSKKKDYSLLWLQLLESDVPKDVTFLYHLLEVLAPLDPALPPSVRPSVPPATMDAGSRGGGGPAVPAATQTMPNSFAALHIDDSDDDQAPVGPTGSASASRPGPGRAARSIQVRYLRIRVSCGVSEEYRRAALEAQRQKEYPVMTSHWCAAHDALAVHRTDTDEWFSMCLLHREGGLPVMPADHDYAQLDELLVSLHVLGADTEKEKERALGFLKKRLRFIEEKLDPMLKERDEVKQRVGDFKWKHNEAPEMSYAEKRLAWEEAKAQLLVAIDTLTRLDFYFAAC